MLFDLRIEDCRRVIREKNDRLRALVHVLPEPLRDPEAAGAPLAGVPYTLKDTWDTPGMPTTGGSWRHRARVPTEAAPVYQALQRSGAVLLGKSNCSDLALAWESFNHLVGATRNPHDESRSAGGSSGGAACAVASGMSAFDWGTDFGGSIRIPAGFCGVTGLRLSSQPWPVNEQHFPRLTKHFWSWVGMGPIAPTVAECRVLLRALRPLRQPFPEVRMKTDEVVLYAPDRACTGRWPTFVADAGRALERAGVRHAPDGALPPPRKVNNLYNAYVSSHFDEFSSTGELDFREGLSAVLLGLVTAGRLDKRVHPTSGALLALLALGQATIYRDKTRWEAELDDLRARVEAVWNSGTLIVAPTTTSLPPRHGRAALDWTVLAFTKLGNLTDATAIALPFGCFEGTTLPRSLQILGPPGSEDAVMDLAERLEARQDAAR
ncbi:MAG TPA: amidase [Polyangiaceae bacterium]|jgi:Asp-tRNA(Asn)/Glu-tRNA(Gln) amidotransferase A subunit family amidase